MCNHHAWGLFPKLLSNLFPTFWSLKLFSIVFVSLFPKIFWHCSPVPQVQISHVLFFPKSPWREFWTVAMPTKNPTHVSTPSSNYVKYCNSKSRRGSSGLYLTTAYFNLHFLGIRFLLDFPIFGMLFLVTSKQKLLCLLLKLCLSLSILSGYTRFLMEIMFVLLNYSVLNVAKSQICCGLTRLRLVSPQHFDHCDDE